MRRDHERRPRATSIEQLAQSPEMSYTAEVLKVMIATPSDLPVERAAMRQLIQDWNNAHSEARKVVLMAVGWDTHAVPEMGDRPQALINRRVLKGCDLLVAAFWTRVGTSTGEYVSGTVEEIEEHLKANGKALLYFSEVPVAPHNLDAEQFAKLKTFRETCRSRSLCESYADIDDFKKKFYQHLQILLNDPDFAAGLPDQVLDAPVSHPSSTVPMDAQALLKAALASDGEILKLESMTGLLLQAGDQNLVESGNARSRARWEGALNDLESLGLISSNPEGTIYRITNEGYDAVDALGLGR
jgi:hypothetical protein